MASVRRAEKGDMASILSLGVRMYKESPTYQVFPLSLPRAEAWAHAAIHDVDKLALVATSDRDGSVIGMFGATVSQAMLIDARMATDILHYVVPEHRNGRIALRFLKWYTDWATINGCEMININTSTGIEMDRKLRRLYEHAGFKRIGSQYGRILFPS